MQNGFYSVANGYSLYILNFKLFALTPPADPTTTTHILLF
jgi:hypothetical protein